MSTYNSFVAEDSADKTIKEVKNMKETITEKLDLINGNMEKYDIVDEFSEFKKKCETDIEHIQSEHVQLYETVRDSKDTILDALVRNEERILRNQNDMINKVKDYSNLSADRDKILSKEIDTLKIMMWCMFGIQLILGVIICLK